VREARRSRLIVGEANIMLSPEALLLEGTRRLDEAALK
jgi:hypothetical protein